MTTFQLTSPVSGTAPFTTGLAFVKGQMTGTPALGIPEQQVVVLARWNDGSVKHAVASGQVALTANTPTTVKVLNSASGRGGTALTAADIQKANPSASVSLGSFGTVRLSTLLGSPVRTFVSGTEMVEAHYVSKVGADPTLQVYFYVRLYKNGRVWIRTSAENGYLDVATSTKSYVPAATVGNATVFDNGGKTLTHYGHTRWTAEGWTGGDPQVTPRLDTTYLMRTKLVPNYWKRSPSAAALNGLYQKYAPNQSGGWTPNMGETGFQNQIGILPVWDALYVTSGGDPRAYRSVLANANALNSYAIAWRDSKNGLPVMPSQRTDWNFGGRDAGGGNPPGAGSLQWEGAHHGSGGYLAYLVTGDYYYLETMQNQAGNCYLQQATGYGGGLGVNRRLLGQTRNVAWCNRTVGQLAAIAPTDDKVGADYRTLFANNTAHWLSVAKKAGANPLTYLYFYEIGSYGPGEAPSWQYDFWTQTYGFLSGTEPLAASGMATLNALRDAQYKQVIGRLGAGGSSGYCFANAARYTLKVAASNSSDPSTWYTTWAQVEAANNGGAACGNTLQGSSGADPGSAATGYWGNMLCAIVYAVEDGAPGASASWARLTKASNFSTAFANSNFNDTPNWGCWPRS